MANILLIDGSSDYRKRLRTEILDAYPDMLVDEYDPGVRGVPGKDFDWSSYQMVLVDEQQEWLQSLIGQTDMPNLILLSNEETLDKREQLMQKGVTRYLSRDDIHSSRFKSQLVESIETIISIEQYENIVQHKQSVPHQNLTMSSEDTVFDLDRAKNMDTELTKSVIRSIMPEDLTLLIPGYDIIREIGKGATSSVLLASRQEDGQQVVLKVIRTTKSDDPQALKRFMQEYSLISYMKHPNIVQIFERGFAADYAYIAMEYSPHGDLNKRISNGLDTETALKFLGQIASALACVHELGVIHRDMKPGNILFKEEDCVCITDFGAAKLNHHTLADITAHNMVIGTPHYMSPEQGAGMRLDHRSDLYSLGVLFYFMLTKRRPFRAASVAQLLSAHMNSPIPRLPDECSRYQPLIDGLLAKDPDDRFQCANELITGIEWLA
jgi:tRNA A-37 threonylcarbamoyl transferase component Bud32